MPGVGTLCSLQLDIGCTDHLVPLLGFAPDKLAELDSHFHRHDPGRPPNAHMIARFEFMRSVTSIWPG
jgi:hypothetical protein